jgi:transcriptional regulator with XRE-family HTH domain
MAPRLESTKVDRLVGARLRNLRQRFGRSSAEVAHRLGIDPGQLARFETGEARLSATDLFELFRTLGVTPADIFAETDRAANAP